MKWSKLAYKITITHHKLFVTLPNRNKCLPSDSELSKLLFFCCSLPLICGYLCSKIIKFIHCACVAHGLKPTIPYSLSIKALTQEFAGNLVGIKRRLRVNHVPIRSYRYKNAELVGTAKGWKTVVGYRHFNYGGAFYRVLIDQSKVNTVSLNACSEFKVIGLPSEHRKSNYDLLTRQLVRFESAVKQERSDEATEGDKDFTNNNPVSLFCGRVIALKRGFLILCYVVLCTSRCSNPTWTV